jgi:hypothetical protein
MDRDRVYLLGYDWREAWKTWKKANLSTPAGADYRLHSL